MKVDILILFGISLIIAWYLKKSGDSSNSPKNDTLRFAGSLILGVGLLGILISLLYSW